MAREVLSHFQDVSDPTAVESEQPRDELFHSLRVVRAAGLATIVPLLTMRPLSWLKTTYCPGAVAESSMTRLLAVSRSRTASTQTRSPPASRRNMSKDCANISEIETLEQDSERPKSYN